MTKKKKEFHIDQYIKSFLNVYVDNPDIVAQEIQAIEGILGVEEDELLRCLTVYLDPRYDVTEVRAEVEQLLSSKVPEVFQEAMENKQ